MSDDKKIKEFEREIKYIKSLIYGLSKDIDKIRADLNTHTNTIGLHKEDQEFPDFYQERLDPKKIS